MRYLFDLEGLTQTLSEEVPHVRFLIVEPGAFRTGLFGKDAAYLSSASGSATFRTNSPSGRNLGAIRRSTSKPCP